MLYLSDGGEDASTIREFDLETRSFVKNGFTLSRGKQNVAWTSEDTLLISREWNAGDRVEFELPMQPQRVKADPQIKADESLLALKYGPLVYNVEAADNQNIERRIAEQALSTEWRPDLLGGVMVITGSWTDGGKLVAIPNYARMNRVGPPHAYPGEEVDTMTGSAAGSSNRSKVWI